MQLLLLTRPTNRWCNGIGVIWYKLQRDREKILVSFCQTNALINTRFFARVYFLFLGVCQSSIDKTVSVFDRSSRPEVFCEKDVLRNFAKFTGKHWYLSLFLIKLQAWRPATLLNKRLWPRCFPVSGLGVSVKFLRSPFFIEHLWWLLLVFNNLLFSSY